MPKISPSSKRKIHLQPKPPFILIPLYIYPTDKGKAWAPLFDAVNKYHAVSFVVIVNPDSGPGRGHRPDENYTLVLEALTRFKNVTILGYVPVCWAKRDVADVARDISVYYHWEQIHDISIRIDGIFFDESPSKATDENVTYMAKASELVRRLATSHHQHWNLPVIDEVFEAFQNHHRKSPSESELTFKNNPCTIIYNPGTPPGPGSTFFDSSTQADYIVIFEQTLETWPGCVIEVEQVEETASCLPSSAVPSSSDCHSSSPSPSLPDMNITSTPDTDQAHENLAAITDPGKAYISRCMASLSTSERATSVAIAHSVSSLDDQLAFVAQAVEYGLAGHFATSTADYASWSTHGHHSPRTFEKRMTLQNTSGNLHLQDGETESMMPWMAYVAAADQLSQLGHERNGSSR